VKPEPVALSKGPYISSALATLNIVWVTLQHALDASCFDQSRSDVPFSFYNWYCDQVCCYLGPFSMESVKEQRICFNFCFKVRKVATETHNMLREAYSDDAWSQMTTYKWFKRFKNGRTSTHDDQQSGQPPASGSEPLIA
jgi:hypothetical protein